MTGNAYFHPSCETCDECEFGSRHRGESNFLWGDGRVTLVSETIGSSSYRPTALRSAN
ncbi:MAG: DUF1559 domain-containing protein [Planctomycetaceae bacterium]|nr:DUF1559 domain-containing protein [Planctomycetaceae bacterium]